MRVDSEGDLELAAPSRRNAFLALHNLPDRCVLDLGELADRIGADKLDLIMWARADIGFARLMASKVTTEGPAVSERAHDTHT
jgi:hypothetical protein